MNKSIRRMIELLGMLAILAGCGGGGAAVGEGGISLVGDPRSFYEQAMGAMKEGKVAEANIYFGAAIDNSPTPVASATAAKSELSLETIITQSYFGRAFTQMLLLPETAPAIDLLADFGQSPWPFTTVFGPTGYLARAYDIHKADDLDLSITGALNAALNIPYARTTIKTRTWEYQRSVREWLEIRIDPVGTDGSYPMVIQILLNEIPDEGYTVSGQCTLTAGDVIHPDDVCTLSKDAWKTHTRAVNVAYFVNDREYYIDPARASGSITVSSISPAIGGSLAFEINDLVIYRGSSTTDFLTINGTFADTITAEKPDAGFLPFRGVCPRARCALSNVAPGLRTSDVIAGLNDLAPILAGIAYDLESAVSNAAASFTIPQELTYSNEGIHITRADMMLLLSTIYFAKSGINAANSWTAEMALDGLIDETGHIIADKQTIVDQLNEFFQLKEEHELDELKANMTSAITYLKECLEAVLNGAAGGLLESTGENNQLYYEAHGIVADAFDALSGPAMFDQFTPTVGANLVYLFDGRVDGSDIPYDAFVLEYGKIKPVEAYFTRLMSNVCSYDLKTHPRVDVFSSSVHQIKDIGYKLFPNIIKNRIGGYHLMKDRP